MEQQACQELLRGVETLNASPLHYRALSYYQGKKLLDFFLAAFALVAFLPIMALIAVWIWLDSPGPVIFKQQRVGTRRVVRNGILTWEIVPFSFYKFRTMVFNADPSLHKAYIQALMANDREVMEKLQGGKSQVLKLVHDPRVTCAGRLLRKYSLDELPQFWNVVRGDLSLVGPRPAIPYEVEMYQPWHFQRLKAKPGITGLWQVSGRNCADFDEMVRLDIDYIEHQSLWLDIKILLKTPLVVFSGVGAA